MGRENFLPPMFHILFIPHQKHILPAHWKCLQQRRFQSTAKKYSLREIIKIIKIPTDNIVSSMQSVINKRKSVNVELKKQERIQKNTTELSQSLIALINPIQDFFSSAYVAYFSCFSPKHVLVDTRSVSRRDDSSVPPKLVFAEKYIQGRHFFQHAKG